jgi:hypothetical protein
MAKRYSVNTENGQVISVEVDGRVYARVDDIPDLKDREMVAHMIPDDNDPEPDEDLEEEFHQAVREMNSRPKPFAWLLLALLAGVAAVMLVIAFISAIDVGKLRMREQSAAGVVVDTVRRSSRDAETGAVTTYIYPLVEYTPAGEVMLRVELPEGLTSPAYAVGDEVTILYDPQSPRDARIDSFGGNLMVWITPAVTCLVGLGFLAAALGFIRFWAPWRKPTDPFAD